MAPAPTLAGLVLIGYVRVPTGPNVMVLPGAGKSFDQFTADDASRRAWATQQVGKTPAQEATESGAVAAAAGTVLGAAGGAVLGAATGHPATGTAVGAGAGLVGGSVVGAGSGESARAATCCLVLAAATA